MSLLEKVRSTQEYFDRLGMDVKLCDIDWLSSFHKERMHFGIPVQVHGLARKFLELLGRQETKTKFLILDDDDRKTFPLKQHSGARTKVNLFFRDVYSDFKSSRPARFKQFESVAGYLVGCYNDEATAWMLWYALIPDCFLGAANLVMSKFKDRAWLGELSDFLKQCGTNGEIEIAAFLELKVLLGRGAAEVDWEKDLLPRISIISGVQYNDPNNTLTMAIISALRSGLGTKKLECPTLEEYWRKRWATTKAGAHSRVIEKELFGHILTEPQATRRHFAEACDINVLLKARACVRIGCSTKLEPGKSRAIYNCDTVSYYHFDRVLRSVEKNWSYDSPILLKPPPPGDERLMTKILQNETFFNG